MAKKKVLANSLKEKEEGGSEAMEAEIAHEEGAYAVGTVVSETVASEKHGPGRPLDDPYDPRKAVTINLKVSSHKKLKVYAVMHDTTASALVESWITEHCNDEG